MRFWLAHDELIFRHRGFQEVLAAYRLVQQGRPGIAVLAQQADGQTWRQPFLYAARLLGPEGFNAITRPLSSGIEPTSMSFHFVTPLLMP